MKFKSIFDKASPAFQLYASDLLAHRKWRSMSLAERGLKATLECECWVNKSVPHDIRLLAKFLSFSEEDIRTNLTDNVMSFFEVKNGEIICPELDDYKVRLDERRKAQSEGGKKGQAIKKRKEGNVIYLEGLPEGSEKRREEQNRVEQKKAEQVFIEETLEEELVDLSPENQAWVDDYNREE
jgi:hypothetical protein